MKLESVLCGMVASGRIPHAILFHEDDGGGAFPLAMDFLKTLYCGRRVGENACGECPSCNKISKYIHPDIHFVFPTAAGYISTQYMEQFRALATQKPSFSEAELNEALGIEGRNSMIAVSEAKHILEVLSLSALEGGYKAVVMYLPEKMNREAANRLLKIIEEPSEKTQFIFITHAPEKVLETISSRCQRIRVSNSSESGMPEFSRPELVYSLMDALLSRNLVEALDVSEKIAALPSREMAKSFCAFFGGALRQMFLHQQGLPSLACADERYASWASRCKKTFPRQALDSIGRAQSLIDRNVNMKILFTDLVNRLYMSI
ncbi:MAG: hypothetical protein MJY89_02670 [Bacteroidales bacterium]|nr:hypothetical protein [Bacteroidales bacterium]